MNSSTKDKKLRITERYSSAIRSSNLRSSECTTYSDPDVIGAFGMAAKSEPFGVALHRLFAGDMREAGSLLLHLAAMITGQFPSKLTRQEAKGVAAGVLAWNISNTCHHCGGLGREMIPGSPTLSDRECKACKGTGKKRFEKQFHRSKIRFADWAQMQIQIAMPNATHLANKFIAPPQDI